MKSIQVNFLVACDLPNQVTAKVANHIIRQLQLFKFWLDVAKKMQTGMAPVSRYLWWSWLQSGRRWRSHRWCWRSRPCQRIRASQSPPHHSWARCSSSWQPGLPGLSSALRRKVPSAWYQWYYHAPPMMVWFPFEGTRYNNSSKMTRPLIETLFE